MKDDTKIEQELAWIGDAVLGLFARNWILEKEKKMDAEMFTRMTSSNFLNSLGNPTKVEAKIGLIFNNEGLEKAFSYIEKSILPLFLKQKKKESDKLVVSSKNSELKPNWMPHNMPPCWSIMNRPFRPPTLSVISCIKTQASYD